MKNFNKIIFALVFLISSIGSASAATISAGDYNVNVGDTFDVSLASIFGTDFLLGGQAALGWDSSIIQFNSFAYNVTYDLATAVPNDMGNPINSSSLQLDWSEIQQTSLGETGNFTLGTVSFTALAAGTSALAFTNASSFAAATFVDGSVVSAVPIPAAVWLFGTGLIGIAGLKRRHEIER